MKTISKKEKILFLGAVALFWFSQYVFIPGFTPYLTSTLAIPASSAGVIVGAYGLIQSLLRIPVGLAGSRPGGSRLIMISGCVALGLAAVLLILFKTEGLLWLSRALSGVGAATWVCFTVYFSNNFGSGGKRSMGAMVGANNFGMMLAYIFSALLSDRLGIKFLFSLSIAASIGAMALLFLLFSCMEKQAAPAPRIGLGDLKKILSSRSLWRSSGFTALSQFISFATMISFSASYAASIGCSGAEIGAISIMNTAAGLIASSLIAAGHFDRTPRKALLGFGFTALFLYCVLLPKCTGILGLLVLQFIGGLGRNFIMTTQMADAISDLSPQLRSTAMGIFQSIYGLGMTLGPVFMGGVLERSGAYAPAYGVMALICLLSAGLSLLIKMNKA